MRNLLKSGILALLPCLLVVFVSVPALSRAGQDVNRCEEPRPQVCTMEYVPVCATLATGGEKTYANGCAACSDAGVDGWVNGACLE